MRGLSLASPWPIRVAGPLVLCAILLLPSGCGVYQAGVKTGPFVNERLPPVDPTRVEFFSGDELPTGAKEVGFVLGVSDVDESWLAMQRLRDAAAKLGADAVFELRFEVLQSSQIVARGRAVRRSATPPIALPGKPASESPDNVPSVWLESAPVGGTS